MSAMVAVMWQRFGPYHLARLRGATDALASDGWRVVGLEVAGVDHYDWRPIAEDRIGRRTLFDDRHYSAISRSEIQQGVTYELESLGPSAVCVNGWSAAEAVAALRWCGRRRVPVVLMSETFESRFNPVKRAIKGLRVRKCDAAIVGGRLHAKYLRELGFSGEIVELGYDAVDNDHFSKQTSAAPTWLSGLQPKRYFFANTRFLRRKGIDALLRAYARYRSFSDGCGSTPWALVISGSGEMECDWKRLAATLDIEESVRWPGFLQYEELPAAYQSAGAFVHPAREEPWGLVVNEAAAAGLPLLVGRKVGASCELVRDGENGFLIEPDDTDSFARTLLRLADLDHETRRHMGLKSREIVSHFGPARFGQALRKCLGLGN